MGAIVLTVVQGSASDASRATDYRDGWLTGLPPLILMALVLLLGLYIPAPLNALLNDAVHFMEIEP
jgi:hydrogenase-4 component F